MDQLDSAVAGNLATVSFPIPVGPKSTFRSASEFQPDDRKLTVAFIERQHAVPPPAHLAADASVLTR